MKTEPKAARSVPLAQSLSTEPGPRNETRLGPLALAALGVVFGDIGTSPLYAFKLCFIGRPIAHTHETVLGILSLITWALILVVCVKYATIVLRADNEGEGGTLALLAQLLPSSRVGLPPPITLVAYLLLFAAGMVLGDGVITPAISVLSAIEGVAIALPQAQPLVLPTTVGVLLALFLVQSRGTGRIGLVFGPVMLLWFVALAAGGILGIGHDLGVIAALNPIHALRFIARNGWTAVITLGSIVLCVTGVEAMFADLAHFGRKPILLAWYCVALPALILNYYGQGALTLANPDALQNPFFLLYPGMSTFLIVVLATLATVIASQALITGAYSLTQQAVQLGYLPRLRVLHTSDSVEGQIFIPFVNALLAMACITLVIVFHSSERLGSAYGLAVTCTMLTDSIVIGLVLHRRFRWRMVQIVPLISLFLIVDLSFLLGNLSKLLRGGYVPVSIALVIFLLFTTWTMGRRRLSLAFSALATPIDAFVAEVGSRPASFAEGTAIFLTPHPDGVPFVLRHHWLKTRVFREEVVILTILSKRIPYVDPAHRVKIDEIVPRLTRISAAYGFMEVPNVIELLKTCQPKIPPQIDLAEADYFFARPRLTHKHGDRTSLQPWRRGLLAFMMRNANPLTDSLGIPPDRIIEFGVEIPV